MDYDEKVKVTQNLITEQKIWIPCVPIPVPVQSKVSFKQVSCGRLHTVAISDKGEVFGCGLTSKGRLGLNQDQIKMIHGIIFSITLLDIE